MVLTPSLWVLGKLIRVQLVEEELWEELISLVS